MGKFYRYVNGKISGRKSGPPIRDSSGNLITDKALQANTFNRYFASVFMCDDGNIPDFPRRAKTNSRFCDVSFTSLKLLRVLNALKPKKSHGPDGFPNLLLKKLGCVISVSYTHLTLPTTPYV